MSEGLELMAIREVLERIEELLKQLVEAQK